MTNKKYGRLVSDEVYIKSVIENMQALGDEMLENGYSHNEITDMIMFNLDRLKIYQSCDIDFVFNNLSF